MLSSAALLTVALSMGASADSLATQRASGHPGESRDPPAACRCGPICSPEHGCLAKSCETRDTQPQCELSQVKSPRDGRLGWVVVGRERQAEPGRYLPLPWPASLREAEKACERWLKQASKPALR